MNLTLFLQPIPLRKPNLELLQLDIGSCKDVYKYPAHLPCDKQMRHQLVGGLPKTRLTKASVRFF
jgi:hypothetical protein